MASKSTKTETDRRVFQILGWLIKGEADYLILKNIQEQWDIGDRMAKKYLEKAREIWKEHTNDDIEQERMFAIAKLVQRQKTLQDKYKGTPTGMNALLAIDKEIHKLRGMHLPRRHVIEGNPEQPISHTVEVKIIQTGVKIPTSEDDVDV
jgi:hypothetical protein